MLKVIAIDPGVTTGYAEGVIEDGYMRVRCYQDRHSHLQLYKLLTQQIPNCIVLESFEFRKLQQGVEYYPVEMIGVVNLYVQYMASQETKTYKPVQLFMQPPATQGDKAYWTNDKLKEHKVYAKGKEHGRSAMKHLLYWYQFGPGYKYNQKGFEPWDES